jgi:hypothetical protein
MVAILADAWITVLIGEEANPLVNYFLESSSMYTIMCAKIGVSFALASFIMWCGRRLRKSDNRWREYGMYTRLAFISYVGIYTLSWVVQLIWEARWVYLNG